MSFSPLAIAWEAAKNIPGLGKIFRIMELLAKISQGLLISQGILIQLQGKTEGDVASAVGAALVAVAAALVAVYAAMGDPEPATKVGLCIAAVASIIAAVIAIKAVIDSVESHNQTIMCENEIDLLKKEQEESDDQLKRLKLELGL